MQNDLYADAFSTLFGVFKEQDLPLAPANLQRETLDSSVGANQNLEYSGTALSEAKQTSEGYSGGAFKFFRSSESPYSTHNLEALNSGLKTWCTAAEYGVAGDEGASKLRSEKLGGDRNWIAYEFARTEFLVSLASYKQVPFRSTLDGSES